MRVLIQNDKDKLVELVQSHLSDLLIGKKVDVILNGEKTSGTIEEIHLEEKETSFIICKVDGKERNVPIMEETKADIGKELVVFETKNHTTVIEVLD